MPNLLEEVRRLARRVEKLEAENASLREQIAEPADTHERRLDRRGLLRMGGVAAAVGAGSVLLRPGAAGATTGAMSFGAENNAGATGTGLTSSNGTDTLHLTNSGAGAGLNVTISDTSNTKSAIHALDGSTDPNSAAVYGEMTDPGATGWGVVGLGFEGGGVQGSSGGSGPGVLGIAGSGSAIVANSDTSNSDICLDVEHDGTGTATYSHIENALSAGAGVYGRTIGKGNAVLASIVNSGSTASSLRALTTGKGAAVEAGSSHGVGGKFSGVVQLYLVPNGSATHPPSAGAMIVDHSGRLWYCQGGTNWKQLA